MTYYTRVFNSKQKEDLSKFAESKEEQFYLAGGTPLALQLGHRTSLDLDFYRQGHLSNRVFAEKLRQVFLYDAVFNGSQAEDTFFTDVAEVKLSIFDYPYPLIKTLNEHRGVKIAAFEDIAVMKIVANRYLPASAREDDWGQPSNQGMERQLAAWNRAG